MSKEQGPKNLTTYEIKAMSQKHHKQPEKALTGMSADAHGITIALQEHSSRRANKGTKSNNFGRIATHFMVPHDQ